MDKYIYQDIVIIQLSKWGPDYNAYFRFTIMKKHSQFSQNSTLCKKCKAMQLGIRPLIHIYYIHM